MDDSEKAEKHFKVVYGKVLGIPVGSATPTTDEGHRIFKIHFLPAFFLIGASVFGSKLIQDDLMTLFFVLVGWIGSVFIFYRLWCRIRESAEFKREYFLNKNQTK